MRRRCYSSGIFWRSATSKKKIFQNVTVCLEKAGLIMDGGSIADTTIITVPNSTRNEEGMLNSKKFQI